jgi:hypothetical protein
MSDPESRVHAMIARACLGARTDEEFARDLRAFLEGSGVSPEDAEPILAAPPRLAVYRRLVRNNLTGVTHKMLARTRARMNDLAEARGLFDATFDAWLDEVGPRTHYLRDVPHELFAWAEPRWRADARVPRWMPDLARHELVEYAVSAADDVRPPPVAEVALDRALVFAPPVRLVRYAFAVHELAHDEQDRAEPREADTSLLVYRDAEHAVRFLALHPFLVRVTERLLAGDTLGDAVRAAQPGDPGDVARYLAELGERGVLLGGSPPG